MIKKGSLSSGNSTSSLCARFFKVRLRRKALYLSFYLCSLLSLSHCNLIEWLIAIIASRNLFSHSAHPSERSLTLYAGPALRSVQSTFYHLQLLTALRNNVHHAINCWNAFWLLTWARLGSPWNGRALLLSPKSDALFCNRRMWNAFYICASARILIESYTATHKGKTSRSAFVVFVDFWPVEIWRLKDFQ